MDWIKKKTTINPKNDNDDRCFQYAATIAWNFGEIKNNPQRVSNIKPFIDDYNWEGTNYLSKLQNYFLMVLKDQHYKEY